LPSFGDVVLGVPTPFADGIGTVLIVVAPFVADAKVEPAETDVTITITIMIGVSLDMIIPPQCG
jgi:hypothetical protein